MSDEATQIVNRLRAGYSPDDEYSIELQAAELIESLVLRLSACQKELDEREDYELCDTCGNLSTETTDEDGDGHLLGHVQCAQCCRMAQKEHDYGVLLERWKAASAELAKATVGWAEESRRLDCALKALRMIVGKDVPDTELQAHLKELRDVFGLSRPGMIAVAQNALDACVVERQSPSRCCAKLAGHDGPCFLPEVIPASE